MASPPVPGPYADLSHEQLVTLVKAAQRYKQFPNGFWQEFVKAGSQPNKAGDPARHTKQFLESFVSALANRPGEGPLDKAARKFVPQYLKWLRKVKKDAAKGRDQLPPMTPAPDPAPAPAATAAAAAAPADGKGPHAAPAGSTQPQQNTVWSLVHRTRSHAKYGDCYGRFPSFLKGWKRTNRHVLCASGPRPRLLAVDCEMCAVEGDDSALLGVCVVDEFGEVVYRELVRPGPGAIRDLRTPLTGVTEADLEGVTLRAKDAQKAIRALLQGEGGRPVVLVGHSLHHDLAALRLDHQPVIDTAMLYGFEGLPGSTPGLRDLAKLLLGVDMREGGAGAHDSREDAAVSMRLVMRELQLSAPTPLLAPPQVRVPAADLAKLCVHSLPAAVARGPREELQTKLAEAFRGAGATPFLEMEGDPGERKVLLVWKNPNDTNNAFKALPGQRSKDSLGRFTKELSLGPPHTCKVRKMACHNGLAFGVTDKSAARSKLGKRKAEAAADGAGGSGGKTPRGGKDGGRSPGGGGGESGERPKKRQRKQGEGAGHGGQAVTPGGVTGGPGVQQQGGDAGALTTSKKRRRRESGAEGAGEGAGVQGPGQGVQQQAVVAAAGGAGGGAGEANGGPGGEGSGRKEKKRKKV